jgi:hypothetical protein
MADEPQVKMRHKGSCFGKLVVLIAFGGMALLGTCVFFVAKPQDLSDIKGRGPTLEKARDLKVVLKNAIDRSYPLTLTEQEINLYLKQTLAAKQGGLLEKAVEFKSVCVRLGEDRAEIIMERSVMGKPMTLSMFVRVEQTLDVQGRTQTSVQRDGGPYLPEVPRLAQFVKGGRFGSIEVPQGFLLLVLPAYSKLAKLYEDEIHLAFEEMSRITIAEDKLVLDPRPDGGAEFPAPGGTY